MKRGLHGLHAPLREVLRHVGCELPAEDVPGRTTPSVVGGVDHDETCGAVEELVQVREVVGVIREVEDHVHTQRKIGGPLPAWDLGFVWCGEDKLPEVLAVPGQDRGGHINAGVRHVRRVCRTHPQEFQDLAVPATPVDDACDAILVDEIVDVFRLVEALFTFGARTGGAAFAIPAVPVPAWGVYDVLHFVTPGMRFPTLGPGFASARRPACFSTLMISPASANA